MKSKSSTTTRKTGAHKTGTRKIISRKDVDAGVIDLDDITTGKMAPIHPGEILKHDVLEASGMTAYRLAKDIKVPVNRITGILAGKRAITAETALRLARYLGTSELFWLNLQSDYDLAIARAEVGKTIRREVTPRAA